MNTVCALTHYLVLLPDGRSVTVEADGPYLAKAIAAVEFGMDELPADALVLEVAS
jgi:hypothetical protein